MPALTFDELDRLTRELASFARAGISMPQGLRQLAASLRGGRLKRLSSELAEALEKGKALSEALQASPLAPPKEFIALVKCAEISGDLRSLLDFAVEHSRRVKRHRSALLTTTIYPILVVITFFGTLYFLCNAIIPKIEAIYAQLHATLPSLTQFLVRMAYAFQGVGGLVLVVVIIALIQGTLWWEPARETMYRLVGILPGFHSLVALSDTAVFMKFVGRMTARGVPL
ncbi:MAG: type II secretion system F family protein, partial [bacterium]